MKRTIFIFVVLGVCGLVVVLYITIFQRNPATKQKISPPSLASSTIISYEQAAKKSDELAFVPRIIDGDTIEVELIDPKTGEPMSEDRVRYIGMDAPETVDPNKPVECFGHEASERNKELVEGKYVLLKKDVSDRDKYGRLLRFVYFLDDPSTSVDLKLVQEGYARILTIPPDTEYEDEFKTAAAEAKAAKLGFWGACAKYPFTN